MPKKLTNDEFLKRVKNVHGNKYKYPDMFKGVKTKIQIICPVHGVFYKTPYRHINKEEICPKCSRLDTLDDFIIKANEKHNYKYSYSSSFYTNTDTKITILCSVHGDFTLTPNKHIQGQGCPKCKTNKLREYFSNTFNDFIIKANKKHDNKYKYNDSVYINNSSKINIVCEKHGEFKQSAANHLSGQGCPKCKRSKGELKIEKMLNNSNIKYEAQKTFNTCRYKYPLKFDFYLPTLRICIEYDGIQHFEIVEKWGGIDNLIDTQNRDKIKTEYCKNNDIKLIRIRYDENIEEKYNYYFVE